MELLIVGIVMGIGFGIILGHTMFCDVCAELRRLKRR